ncbi:hypothetical protein WR25_15121 [Diploscapter pachys]|uniref:C2H2-type domain-containing protein n=1 Tax=Diploscapter pachys TaxID=2018661 RepID=A0A2A2LM02_9BILA|nr:hypothetical protein WR25_15121 [Diploscapter pachys]
MSDIETGSRLVLMPFDSPKQMEQQNDSDSSSPAPTDPSEILRLLSESAIAGCQDEAVRAQFERCLPSIGQFDEAVSSGMAGFGLEAAIGQQSIHMQPDFLATGFSAMRNTSKTLKCPKCNWHYKYQETLEIHMKEKHAENEIKCIYCLENRVHPKLSRGESYSCGYKPYRCELCKYSTTTKGNLSIHMQSDKHLHAVQDLPNSIAAAASFPCPPTSRSPVPDGDATFVCLVCGSYSTDDSKEILEHAEKDRSRPAQGDLSMTNGSFRCFLCPYSTGLKANFQLHMRTDKHIQKVQTRYYKPTKGT